VGTRLNVTPDITRDGHMLMTLKPEQSFQVGTSGGVPIVDSRTAETTVLVKDGQTVVIGGLRKREDTRVIDKVPLLGDIPIFGHLFRHKDFQTITTELLMFVTPRIITKPRVTRREQKRYEDSDEQIIEGIKQLDRDIAEFKVTKKKAEAEAAIQSPKPEKTEIKTPEKKTPSPPEAENNLAPEPRETNLPELSPPDIPPVEPPGRDWDNEERFIEEPDLKHKPDGQNRGYIYHEVIPESVK
jgi:Flp pilus assembly secretin CpaC